MVDSDSKDASPQTKSSLRCLTTSKPIDDQIADTHLLF